MSMVRAERARRRSRASRFILGLVLPLTLLTGAIVDAPPSIALPIDPADIDALPQPTVVPEWVWRVDSRSWEEIERSDGFLALGDNRNLADHILALERPNRSWFVATSDDVDFPKFFGPRVAKDGEYWAYKIAPDERYISVQKTMKVRLENDPKLAEQMDDLDDQFLGNIAGEFEWVTGGKIDLQNIKSAQRFAKNEDGEYVAQGDPIENPAFRQPDTRPDIERVYEWDGELSCARGRATCAKVPSNEDELADAHRERWDGEIDEPNLTYRPSDLIADESAMLVPSPSGVGVIGEGNGSLLRPGDMEKLGQDFVQAVEDDLDSLAKLSQDAGLLDDVGAAAGKDLGGDLLPYFGIAATGYALTADIEAGKWGDVVADSIAEAVQIAMATNPELVAILEPVLIADLVLQALGDFVWSWVHPEPIVSAEHRQHVEKAADRTDEISDEIVELWDEERQQVTRKLFVNHVTAEQPTIIATKVEADLRLLRAVYDAGKWELDRNRRTALAIATSPAERYLVERAHAVSVGALRDVAVAKMEARVSQYGGKFRSLLTEQANEIATSELRELRREFVQRLEPTIFVVTDLMWDMAFARDDYEFGRTDLRGFDGYAASIRDGIAARLRLHDEHRTRTATPLVSSAELGGMSTVLFQDVRKRVLPNLQLPPKPELPNEPDPVDPGPVDPDPVDPDPEVPPPVDPAAWSAYIHEWDLGSGEIELGGRGQPGHIVREYRSSSIPGTTVGDDGRWTLRFNKQNTTIIPIYFYVPGGSQPFGMSLMRHACFEGTAPPNLCGGDGFAPAGRSQPTTERSATGGTIAPNGRRA